MSDYYTETWNFPYQWDTKVGRGLKGYIKSIYIWSTYKALTNLYYTPRRNTDYRLLDRCSAFAMQGMPSCKGCDQYLGLSTCYSSCATNTYGTYYTAGACTSFNCTNKLCIACYSDTSSKNNNYCTACIPNASLLDGTVGFCKCNTGFYYDSLNNQCFKCHPYCYTCTGPLPS